MRNKGRKVVHILTCGTEGIRLESETTVSIDSSADYWGKYISIEYDLLFAVMVLERMSVWNELSSSPMCHSKIYKSIFYERIGFLSSNERKGELGKKLEYIFKGRIITADNQETCSFETHFFDAASDGSLKSAILREISLMRELDHPNTVRLVSRN
ncbi:unnamed protein product [Onchocerca flexuosa]|uniref:Protein kinase domain-containing protein n=1 Tax=Onchocerca flexuosa TaxID=387005 RepID=A0A183I2E3_9BILA|nr:unnamed protein product [Onchocerca flexuosa]